MGRACSTYTEGRETFRVLALEAEGKKYGKLTLKRAFDKQDARVETGLDWLGSGQEHATGCCEKGNKPSGSTKCKEFLDQMRKGLLLKNSSLRIYYSGS